MYELSASEASRNFSSVLDSAERGETIAVTRGGRRVALVIPAPASNGRALGEVLRRWRSNPALDDVFAAHVESAGRTVSADLDGDPWHD